jgi:hypothetical protein
MPTITINDFDLGGLRGLVDREIANVQRYRRADPQAQDHAEYLDQLARIQAAVDAASQCARCKGTGWLDPIGPCDDGSYITSRECSSCRGTGRATA